MCDKVSRGGRSQLLREPDVLQIIQISRSTLWRLVRQGTFPRPLKLSVGATAWKADEVEDWIETRKRVGT
jgi:prophage regulatory protein